MTDEEIKKLAQSYVDELFADDDMQDQENIENKNDALVMCMAFAGHILEKHCIVPKSKVQDEYAEASNTYWQKYSEESQMDSRHDVYERGYNVGIMNVMEDIFGKDMFEEEKL